MTNRAGKRYPRVNFASPGWHPPSAIHSAAAEKGCIRRVHNGINVQRSDVSAYDLDHAVRIFLLHDSSNNDEARMTNDE